MIFFYRHYNRIKYIEEALKYNNRNRFLIIKKEKKIHTTKGSTPGERIKKIGVELLDSSKDLENSIDLASTYFDPSFSSTKHRTAYVILSGRKVLIIHNLCNAVLVFHSPGNFSFSGASDSTNLRHL